MDALHPEASAEIPQYFPHTPQHQDHDSWADNDYIPLQSETPLPSSETLPSDDYPILDEDTSYRVAPWLYLAAFILVLYWIVLYIKKYYNSYLMKLETL